MVGFVLIIVAIGIVTERRRLTSFMGRQEGSAIGLSMAPGCKIARHPFEFGHDLEHFEYSFGAKLGDDGAPPRPDRDEPDSAQLHQRLPDGRSRNAIAGCEL